MPPLDAPKAPLVLVKAPDVDAVVCEKFGEGMYDISWMPLYADHVD